MSFIGLWFPRGVESEKDENSIVVPPEIKKPKRRKKLTGPRKVRKRAKFPEAEGEQMVRATKEGVQRRPEIVLTADETDFGLRLESLAELEKQAKSLDAGKLRASFKGLQITFSKLPSGSRMRTEIMKGVVGQLAEEGEKLKKAGKPEADIFEEWLKRVFIPLYRRAKKKP